MYVFFVYNNFFSFSCSINGSPGLIFRIALVTSDRTAENTTSNSSCQVARQRLDKHVPAATSTYAKIRVELLNASLSMPSVRIKGKKANTPSRSFVLYE
jgi:hypothetical protein